MQQNFVVTRTVLVLMTLGLLAWGLTFLTAEAPETAEPSPSLQPPNAEPDLPSWEETLASPEIQAVWQERRLLLADLSRRFRAETDSARAAALRDTMEQLITQTERDIAVLRLERARNTTRESAMNP